LKLENPAYPCWQQKENFKKAQQAAAELSKALLQIYCDVNAVHKRDEKDMQEYLKTPESPVLKNVLRKLQQSHDTSDALCKKFKEVVDLVQALVAPLVLQGLSKRVTGIQERLEIKIEVDEKNETLLLEEKPDIIKKVRRRSTVSLYCGRIVRRF
jgi:ketopantoate reductase